MAEAGLTAQRLAEHVDVDPKSVERWLSQGRVPHARTRLAVATVLDQEESHLWPSLLGSVPSVAPAPTELEQMWPSRSQVPVEIWQSLIEDAQKRVDILVYAGGFIVETFRLIDRITELSDAGGSVRILIGDSQSDQLQQRGLDEGLPSLPWRAASTWEYLAGVRDLPGVDIRVHSTPLYVSVYRFDDTLMVNPHTHGLPAKDNPVLRLRRIHGGQLFDYYTAAYERVWDEARDPACEES
ncbi:XRE family transcriptional regulator [Luteipulveratus mongoliensis]|uniref:XRE family transcriptional regulator n=1 Tax=Luteipulveratus mongoliensis TaxID=571913 RepID=UPI0012EDCF11|nr:XRE family transcriptional regulator [Luteipulveratus mongoliensis]